MITVRAGNPAVGVTCGELIESICENMQRHVSKQEMKTATKQVTQTYWYNRSTAPDVPGGRLGDGVRRVDWLLRFTGFDGIERNDDVARTQCGGVVLPCTFELKCDQKFAPDEDLVDEEPRPREELRSREELRPREEPRLREEPRPREEPRREQGSPRQESTRPRSRASPRVNIIR